MRFLPHIFLFLFAGFVFWPGITTTDAIDRAEPRYTQVSKQMLESGEYGHTKIRNFQRNEEPIGLHWAQIAGVKLSGANPNDVWGYRLASWLSMSLLIVLAFAFGQSILAGIAAKSRLAVQPHGQTRFDQELAHIIPRDPAKAAGLLAAITLMVPWYAQANAKLANPEALFMLCMGLMFWSLWEVISAFEQGKTKAPLNFVITFWLAMAASFLFKGPVAVVIVGLFGLSYGFMTASWQWCRLLRLVPGLIILSVITLPWVIWTWIASGGEYVLTAIGCQYLWRAIGEQAKHGNPPGFYLLEKPLFWIPFIFLLFPTIGWAYKNLRNKAVLFLVCWILPSWIFYELYATKYPSYMLQFYLAFALLVTGWLIGGDWLTPKRKWFTARHLIKACAVLWILLLAVFAAVPVLYPDQVEPVWPIGLALVWIAATMFIVWRSFNALLADCWPRFIGGLAASVAMFYIMMFGWLIPSMSFAWVSKPLGEAVMQHAASMENCEEPAIVGSGYTEPSAVFYTSKNIMLSGSAAGGISHIAKTHAPCGVFYADNARSWNLDKALKNSGVELTPINTVSGLKYTNMRNVDISLYEFNYPQSRMKGQAQPYTVEKHVCSQW